MHEQRIGGSCGVGSSSSPPSDTMLIITIRAHQNNMLGAGLSTNFPNYISQLLPHRWVRGGCTSFRREAVLTKGNSSELSILSTFRKFITPPVHILCEQAIERMQIEKKEEGKPNHFPRALNASDPITMHTELYATLQRYQLFTRPTDANRMCE